MTQTAGQQALRDEVRCRLAVWSTEGLQHELAEDDDGLQLQLRREDVGAATVALTGGSVTSSVQRGDAPPLTATTVVSSEADFGRLLDGVARLLEPPVDEDRVTRRQKRAAAGPQRRPRKRR